MDRYLVVAAPFHCATACVTLVFALALLLCALHCCTYSVPYRTVPYRTCTCTVCLRYSSLRSFCDATRCAALCALLYARWN